MKTKIIEVNGVVQRFIWIEPGTFLRGSIGNKQLQEVTLTKGYWLADTTCTQALWQAVMGYNPSEFKDKSDNPVEQVSWYEVQTFLQRLNTLISGLNAGLPTEAEWEYACRAGTLTPFSFGENITPEQVNYDGSLPYAGAVKGEYRGQTVPVASFPPNLWGLYEMHGNVWEWCADWYSRYPYGPQIDPSGPLEGSQRVMRGGSWGSFVVCCRSAYRDCTTPKYHDYDIGFRIKLQG